MINNFKKSSLLNKMLVLTTLAITIYMLTLGGDIGNVLYKSTYPSLCVPTELDYHTAKMFGLSFIMMIVTTVNSIREI